MNKYTDENFFSSLKWVIDRERHGMKSTDEEGEWRLQFVPKDNIYKINDESSGASQEAR